MVCFFYLQRLDLSMSENSRTLPGLKLSNPYNKLCSLSQDRSLPPAWDRPPSVQLPVQVESCSPLQEALESVDPSVLGNITIPRPQGRKTPEVGTVLAPPAVQPRSKAAAYGEGRTAAGREEFKQALSMTSDEPQQRPTKAEEDLISLLDPLGSSAQSSYPADRLEVSPSSGSRPTLPPRPYPQGLPPFHLHPHVSLNPFAQSLQHYSPTVGRNPFSAIYGPPPGSYIHAPSQPQPFSTLGPHRQPSPCSSALPPSPAAPRSGASLPRCSDSLVDFSTRMNTLPLPQEPEKPKDPFGELLSMATPVIPHRKKAEELRRKWETFD